MNFEKADRQNLVDMKREFEEKYTTLKEFDRHNIQTSNMEKKQAGDHLKITADFENHLKKFQSYREI